VTVALYVGLQANIVVVYNAVQEATLYASCLMYSQDSVSVSSIWCTVLLSVLLYSSQSPVDQPILSGMQSVLCCCILITGLC